MYSRSYGRGERTYPHSVQRRYRQTATGFLEREGDRLRERVSGDNQVRLKVHLMTIAMILGVVGFGAVVIKFPELFVILGVVYIYSCLYWIVGEMMR